MEATLVIKDIEGKEGQEHVEVSLLFDSEEDAAKTTPAQFMAWKIYKAIVSGDISWIYTKTPPHEEVKE